MRQPFHGCEPDYIAEVCHGRCCESSTHPSGIMVTIHRSEAAAIEAAGGVVVDGFLAAVDRRCPFKTAADLCGLHGDGDNRTGVTGSGQPFGCVASPFTLNRNDTLIVRNRYRLLRCYKDGDTPAYRAFATSLVALFGADRAEFLAAHLEAGGGDLYTVMAEDVHEKLRANDNAKRTA